MVRVLLGRQRASNVAHDLEEQSDGEGDEVPTAEANGLHQVNNAEDEEPYGSENGEGECWAVAVDDNGRVPGAIGWREVGVDVPIDGRTCM